MQQFMVRAGSSPCILSLALCLLTFVSAGCGRKGFLHAPEDVAPKYIADLSASSSANGIELSWSRPATYTDGSRMTDLGGFVVERSAAAEPRLAFQRISTLEVGDRDRFRQIKRFRYVDRDVAAGTYLYRVVSFTVDRYFSAPSNIVTVELVSPTGDPHAPPPTAQR